MTTNDQRIAKTMQSLGEIWVIGGAAGAFLTMLVIEFELIKTIFYNVYTTYEFKHVFQAQNAL